jgi:hypothetical protein
MAASYRTDHLRKCPAKFLPLNDQWYLDCCLNLSQKLQVLDPLRYVDFSPRFIEMARRFVSGTPLLENSIQ